MATTTTTLPNLCSEVQENIARLLSVRDLLALGSVCWQAEVARILSRVERRTRGITTINMPAPALSSKEDVAQVFESFLSELGSRNPVLAMLYVPHHFDHNRQLDISTIFPAHTTVVKLQGQVLGSPAQGHDLSLQAVLFSHPIREDIKISYMILKEYDNGTFKQFHVDNRKLEDVEKGEEIHKTLNKNSAFNVVFEVTNEMKSSASALSSSKVSCVYGTNYVISSHIPRTVFSGSRKFEGLRKVKREFINGFLISSSASNFWTQSLLLDNVSWQKQLRLINYSEFVFTFIFVPKKASADLMLIIDTQLVRRLPQGCYCVMPAWSHRFSTSFGEETIDRAAYARPQPLEELRFSEYLREDSTEGLPVLKKISQREEILVIQIDYGVFKPFLL